MQRERLNEAELRWLEGQGLLCNGRENAGSLDLEEVSELLRWMPRALWPQSEQDHDSETTINPRKHRGMGQYD